MYDSADCVDYSLDGVGDADRRGVGCVLYYAVDTAGELASVAGGGAKRCTGTIRGGAGACKWLLARLGRAWGVFGAAAGLVAAVVAARAWKAALRRLRETARESGASDEGRLDRRIDTEALPVELQPMADRLNEMLGRIEAAFARQNQFVAGASHEVRTPGAALVTTLDVALRHPR